MAVTNREHQLYDTIMQIRGTQAETLAELKAIRRDITRDEEDLNSLTQKIADIGHELIHIKAYTKACAGTAAVCGGIVSWIMHYGGQVMNLWQ